MFGDEFIWVEKWRPNKIDDCILSNELKKTFNEIVKKGSVLNMLFSGRPGIGKTTVARALCEEIGCDYLLINGSEDRGIATIQTQVKNYASSMSLTGGKKVIILDEADNLTPDAQKALRGVMEDVSMNCTFIFTCNYKNRIIDALHSRCSIYEFNIPNAQKPQLAAQFFKRIQFILEQEKVKYDKNSVLAIVMKHFPDNRRILNELQRHSLSGEIDSSILSSGDIELTSLIKLMKEKDFTAIRKWVTENSDNDSSLIFRKLYDNLNNFLKPQSIPPIVLIIAKYMYQSAFVADQEINLVACIVEILIEAEFK